MTDHTAQERAMHCRPETTATTAWMGTLAVEGRWVAGRQENGIPLKASLVNELIKIADELELEFPARV
jgi:hypothetical protein